MTITIEKIDEKIELTDLKKLVLYNDDSITFGHVIECLVSVCGHSCLQAEQCATIVHYTGRCVVKNGSYEELEPFQKELSENNLTVEIE